MQVGGKTGTTNDTFDIWFDGFTPNYSAALWIGTDLNVEMNTTSTTAAALWSRIMRQVDGIRDGEYREMPPNVIKENGEYYTRGTEKNPGGYVEDNDDEPEEVEEEPIVPEVIDDATNVQPGTDPSEGGTDDGGDTPVTPPDGGGDTPVTPPDGGGDTPVTPPDGGGGTPSDGGGTQNP